MFSETVRRSPATLTGHHHRCYFGARAETCKCSTLMRFMSVGMVLCSGAERGQAQPRAGSDLGEGAELQRGDVSAYWTRGRRGVLFPLPTCATVSGIMNQSCSFCVKCSASEARQPWSVCLWELLEKQAQNLCC